MTSEYLLSFAPLASRYDGFILDLWGVIHDGERLYPGAKHCLKQLKRAGKKIVLLSNAPRRASTVADNLQELGVGDEDYDAVVTSGEVAYRCLAIFPPPTLCPPSGGKEDGAGEGSFAPPGDRYIYIGLDKDREMFAGLPCRETDDPATADFLVLQHFEYSHQPMSELEPLLAQCLAAKLPALCINPDLETLSQSGEHVWCAGLLAQHYAALGGQVSYFGKPYNAVYAMAMELLAGLDKQRVLAVGDTLPTDIAGGNAHGLATALITGGVLKEQVGEPGTEDYLKRCGTICAQAGVVPSYLLGTFNW